MSYATPHLQAYHNSRTKDTLVFERLTSSIFFAPAQAVVSIAAVSFLLLDSDEGDIPKNSKTGHSIVKERELQTCVESIFCARQHDDATRP